MINTQQHLVNMPHRDIRMPPTEGDNICELIAELQRPETRDNALLELCKKREVVPDLGSMLWHSPGTITALLEEVVNTYVALTPPTLTATQSYKACNVLALLGCVASHPETRSAFLQINTPLFIYPFLESVSKSKPFEFLRLSSLGVISALVKTNEQDVIKYLLEAKMIPLCLGIMESGSELNKTIATFILQKVLLDETGLSYICQTYKRFAQVTLALRKIILSLAKEQSARLLKMVICCYLRLSDNPKGREALRECLPDQLRDNIFISCLKDEECTKHWLSQLLKNLDTTSMEN